MQTGQSLQKKCLKRFGLETIIKKTGAENTQLKIRAWIFTFINMCLIKAFNLESYRVIIDF